MKSEKGLEYTILGEGTPIVWVHGLCENYEMWFDCLKALPNFKHIHLNLPGCGNSAPWVDFSLNDIVSELISILNSHNITQAHFIGHSMGGYVGLELIHQTNICKAIFLVNSSAYADSEEKKKNRERGVQVLLQNRELYMLEFFKNLYSEEFKQKHMDVVRSQYEASKSIPIDTVIATMRSLMHRLDHEETLKQATLRKIFIAGSEDAVIPLPDIEKQARNTGSELFVMMGCGHVSPIEQPQEFITILKNLLY